MSFFKDFKDDLSLAVNELLPGEDFEMEEELEEELNTYKSNTNKN